MSFYKKENGLGWDWHNIIGGVITVLVIAFVTGGFNWFLNVRDMKSDIKVIKAKQSRRYLEEIAYNNRQAKVINQIGECVWAHIHPKEAYPFADLHLEPIPDGNNK